MLSRLLRAIALFTFTSVLFAQTSDGTISGFVFDPSGSGVPNAKVTLKNSGTQVAVNTQTNGAGFYTFQFVVPGTYEVSVESTGFQRQVHPDLHVQVAQSVRQDFSLVVGQMQQEVTSAERTQPPRTSRSCARCSSAGPVSAECSRNEQLGLREFPNRRRRRQSE
jgi:carboxypeptidase family protein